MKKLMTMILLIFATAVMAQTVTDERDGQIYNTVTIGTQTWMSQNLNYGPGYCYNNLPANCDLYGKLYTWDQIGSVCPSGWRIPTKADVEQLYDYLGGISVAGAKLKKSIVWEPYASHTNPPSTNESGFSATFTGTRWNTGVYKYLTSSGLWWTSTEEPAYNSAYYFGVGYYMNSAKLGQLYKDQAAGVRCIKN